METLLVFGPDPADSDPSIPPPSLARLTGRVHVLHADQNSLDARLPLADVLLVWDFASDAVRRAWPGAGRRPRWVHTASAGVDRLLCPELAESDTVVTNARGVFEQPIAEYVTGLVLAMAKDFPGTLELQRQHRWQHRETLRVDGSRATVVGAGPIGRAIAGALRGLGVEAAVVGRTSRSGVHATEELPLLLSRSDWVICAAPLTESTHGMFDARLFRMMRPSARFVNVGRGPLVVEDDLVAALTQRLIAGAALDVFENEPLAENSPLWDAPGLIVSPHMSGDTIGWRNTLAEQFVELYERWAAGQPLPEGNVVDKKLGYVPVN
jgi:phosphoglycerate dehydrogenase-like enzyme